MNNITRTSLAKIDRKLSQAVKLLDAAARDLRDAGLNPRKNIPKIGAALVAVFEVQHQIYRRVPALAPEWMKRSTPKRRRSSAPASKSVARKK